MALSFSEKRSLQKTVDEKQAELEAGSLSFSAKRAAQRDLDEALVKLGSAAGPATTTDVNKIMPLIQHFIGRSQLAAMGSGARGEEGQFFKDKFLEIAKTIQDMPATYQAREKGNNAQAVLHYFKGGSDWYIIEKDKEESQDQAYGYAILNGDTEMAEVGYISIEELIENNVELDLYWTPKTLGQLRKGKSEDDEGGNERNDKQRMIDAIVGYGGELLRAETPSDFFQNFSINGVKAMIELKGSGFVVHYNDTDGNSVTTDSYINPDDAVGDFYRDIKQQPKSQKLADLLAGKYNSEPPEGFLKLLKDIIEEIKDIEPIKAPTIAYIEANKDKVSSIMESALREVFGRLWGAAA